MPQAACHPDVQRETAPGNREPYFEKNTGYSKGKEMEHAAGAFGNASCVYARSAEL